MSVNDILGMNARNHLYQAKYNSRRAKKIADSKLKTKKILRKNKLSVPKLYRIFKSVTKLEHFDFTKLPESFVVKPSQGLGGEGILVVDGGQTVDGRPVSSADLNLHILDILSGR